jgi:hypothetical protein
MKHAFVFWNVIPCILAEAYRRFEGNCYLHFRGRRGKEYLFYFEDGGSKFVRNVGKFLTEHTASRLRRQYSSQSLPQEPQILHSN